MTNQACVYLIVNTETGMTYVGSSSSVKVRFSSHVSTLNGGKHANPQLQADWLKHGADKFTFTIVEEFVGTKQEQAAREQHWLDKLKADTSLYNVGQKVGIGGPRISGEMRLAIEMVKNGATRYEAAKASGVTPSAITRSRLYKEWIEQQKAKDAASR